MIRHKVSSGLARTARARKLVSGRNCSFEDLMKIAPKTVVLKNPVAVLDYESFVEDLQSRASKPEHYEQVSKQWLLIASSLNYLREQMRESEFIDDKVVYYFERTLDAAKTSRSNHQQRIVRQTATYAGIRLKP